MIDHLVLATPNVRATAERVAHDWGIHLTPGGSHEGAGTRNELTGLGGRTYLEVVGPDDDQPEPGGHPTAGPRPFGIDDLTEARLVAWCVRPARRLDDVATAVAAFGVDLGGVAAMSRRRPDGVLLEWRLTFPLLGEPHRGTLPFLIDWADSPHPATTLPHECTLVSLCVTHPNPQLVRAVIAEVGDLWLVEVSEGCASLAATVRTPNGVVTL